MILFTFIGIIFIAIGSTILFLYQYYLKNARRLKGRVIAYEAYNEQVGKYSHKNHQYEASQNVKYYRPFYEYYFQNERVVFCGSGSSTLNKKIGESIEILSLDKGPEFCWPVSKTPYVFFSVFTLIGAIALVVSFMKSEGLEIQIIPFVITTIIFISLYRRFKKSNINIFESLLKNNQIIDEKSLENRKVFWTQDDLMKEYNKSHKASRMMGIIGNLIFISITIFFWTAISLETQQSLKNIFQNENIFESLKLIIMQSPLVLAFLIMLFFSAIVVLSTIQSINKDRSV